MKGQKFTVGSALAAVLFAGGAIVGPAYAGTEAFSKTVSCTNGTYTNVRDWTQVTSGAVSVRQASSNPQIIGRYHLQSSMGNNTSAQNIGDGVSKSFGPLAPAVYKTWHTAAASVNCNGSGVGNGNSATTGSVTHS